MAIFKGLKYLSVLTLITLNFTSAQLPIPKRMVGYVYNNVSSDAPIHLDIHMGPLCPDSAGAFPVAKEVAVHYGANLRLTLHMFPLPYHHQAYLTAIGAHVIDKVTSKKMTYDWIQAIYADLDPLGNAATMNMTGNEVISLLATYAQKCCSVAPGVFTSTMAEQELESETRTAWKYSCSRSVSGTPTYFLNDVPIEADPAWTLNEWKQVIDPLLNGAQVMPPADVNIKKVPMLNGVLRAMSKSKVKVNKDCPSDTKKCTYLPGKVECCTKGEACIPNVGCRC